MSNFRDIKSAVKREVKKALDVDLSLFQDQFKELSVYKRFGKQKSTFYITSQVETFKQKLYKAHAFIMERGLTLTPTKIYYLMKLPKDWKEQLIKSGKKNAHIKIDLLDFYFKWVELDWEEKMTKTKEGQLLLFNKFYNQQEQVKENSISINFVGASRDLSSVDKLDDTIDITPLKGEVK